MDDDLLELTRYRQTTIEGNKTTHRRYQGQQEVWIKTADLGSGAFGSVWLERDAGGSQARAVKRVAVRGTSLDYRKEVAALAKLRRFEEHFVYFHGWYEDRDAIYLAMDYFPLGDLSRHLTNRIPEAQVREITRQLLHGLQAMHGIGFCHRDLKPLNIFVAQGPPGWKVKIGDFGIAKRVHGDDTVLKTAIGTPAYMAPEMFPYLIDDEESHPYTEAVDIWALGSVIYQTHTLLAPFGTHNPVSRFVRGKTSFPDADLRAANVTPDGTDFLQVLLQPFPEDRPSAIDALNHPWIKDVVASEQIVDSGLEGPFDTLKIGGGVHAWDSAPSARWTTLDSTFKVSGQWNTDRSGVGRSRDAAIQQPHQTELYAPAGGQGVFDWRRSQVLKGHAAGVVSVCFSSDGHLLASGGLDNAARIWNMAGEEATCFMHNDMVYSVAISSNGLLASGSQDGKVRIWNIATGKEIKPFIHNRPVLSVAFSPGGMTVASGADDGSVKLWDIRKGRLMKSYGGSRMVYSVALSPNGRLIASDCHDGCVQVWDTVTEKEVKSYANGSFVRTVSFSPEGKLMASASYDGQVRIWDVVEQKQVQVFEGHKMKVNTVSFSPDGKLTASGSVDKTIRLWDVAAGTEIQRLEGHAGNIYSVDFSPHGRLLASGSTDRTVRLWGDVPDRPIQAAG